MATLVFVYNAKADWLSAAWDVAHKIISPHTYACELCGLTHGAFKEKQLWKNYRETSNITLEFYYKNQFVQHFDASVQAVVTNYPVVLWLDHNTAAQVFMTKAELKKLQQVEDLITAIEARKKQFLM